MIKCEIRSRYHRNNSQRNNNRLAKSAKLACALVYHSFEQGLVGGLNWNGLLWRYIIPNITMSNRRTPPYIARRLL